MTLDQKCELFRRTEDDIKAVRQVFGLTENNLKEGVDSLLEWQQKQPHLVHLDISRTFMEMMIVIAKGSVERAKEKIDNFFKYRSLLSDLLENRDELLYSSDRIWDIYTCVPLPKLQDNRRIVIMKFGKEMDKFNIIELLKRITLLVDLRMMYDYMAGDIWIIDMEHVSWTQTAQVLTQNPFLLKKTSDFFAKSLNWRLYGIQVINISTSAVIVQRMVDFFKPLIPSVIIDRIIIHESVEDLYNYVPKEILPEDYGGYAPSLEKLTEITESEYRKPKTLEYLLKCTKMVSNESLRPRDENSEEYLPGSFRKLEVD